MSNNLPHITIHKKQTSKKLKLLFIIIYAVQSLDFGFIKPKNTLLKWQPIIQCVILIIVLEYYYLKIYDSYWPLLWTFNNLLQYFIYVTLTQFTNEARNFYKFHQNLNIIDEKMDVKTDIYGTDTKLVTVFLINASYRIVLGICYCTLYEGFCELPFMLHSFFILIMLTYDTVLILYTNVIYSIHCRLNSLTKLIKKRDWNIPFYKDIYKSLADTMDAVKSVFNYMFTVALSFGIYHVMATIYYPLTVKGEGSSFTHLIVVNLTILHSLILFFSPAFTGGKLTAQFKELRIILYNRLTDDRDDVPSYVELGKLIQYIEARPFKLVIAKIIPLDYSLLVIVLNIIVTYMIILIQFTHLY